ncbi:DUF3304 domain-containing protein [Massilia yuzhufengensis]|uniref:DUF3304 domain-containing protein n=1 Tax=Massilia yuzhufengensis TaxID=1164594 RepID=UPI00351CCBEF
MNRKSWLIIIFSILHLSACSRNNRTASIELSGLNYKEVGIAEFSVDGSNGHSIFPNGGGGAFVCCITIQRTWHAGMKVNVRWIEDAKLLGPWKKRVVEVPKYTEHEIGIFAVHFYPDDTVKVLVTTKIIGHPDYPYPRPN